MVDLINIWQRLGRLFCLLLQGRNDLDLDAVQFIESDWLVWKMSSYAMLQHVIHMYCTCLLQLHYAVIMLYVKCFKIANRCTYLLVLESTKIYIKIYIKMLLHFSVYDHHQGACI